MKLQSITAAFFIAITIASTDTALARQDCATDQAAIVDSITSRALVNSTGMLLSPVVIVEGDGTREAKPEARQACVEFLTREYGRVIAQVGKGTKLVAPGVLRVELRVTDIKAAKPVLSTVTHLLPISLVSNVVAQGSGKESRASGSITYECRISDAVSGQLLEAFTVHAAPHAMDMKSGMSTAATIERSAINAADDFAHLLVPAGSAAVATN